jgi:hypothetical protein
MGRLSFRSGKGGTRLAPLRNGCFTVDSSGRILASTLPSTFPREAMDRLAEAVLAAFRGAREARVSLTEFQMQYPALKVTARDLRGGAIVFLAPTSPR